MGACIQKGDNRDDNRQDRRGFYLAQNVIQRHNLTPILTLQVCKACN